MMLIAVVPVCLAQTSPAKPAKSASNETAITHLETSAWEAYKNKQTDAFKKLMSEDYCGEYAEGIKNLDREVADMAKTDLRDYSLAEMKVVKNAPFHCDRLSRTADLKRSGVDSVATTAFTVHATQLQSPSGSPCKNCNFQTHLLKYPFIKSGETSCESLSSRTSLKLPNTCIRA